MGGAFHRSPGSKACSSQIGVIDKIPVIHRSHGVVRRRTCFGMGGFGGSPCSSQLHQGGFTISEAFPKLDGLATALVGKKLPDFPAAGTSKQPPFTVTNLPPQELQHGLRI